MLRKIKCIFFIGLFFSLNFLFTGCGREKKSNNILRVGIDLKYPPFMYIDDTGNPAGFEVDLAYAFGKYLGRKVEIVNTDFSMLSASLDSEETDILISDMSVTKERKVKMDFLKKFADYFIFLDKGKILEHGQIDKLNNPATKELNFFLKGINI